MSTESASSTKPAAEDSRYVVETLLKKRKNKDRAQAANAALNVQKRKDATKAQKYAFKRAEQFIKEHKAAEKDKKRCRLLAFGSKKRKVIGDNKLVFVLRTRNSKKVCPRTHKALQTLRLLHVNDGVFVRLNDITAEMLAVIAPYVTWGEPNLKSIKQLIYKRGFGKIDNKKVALTDNAVVEKALGTHGVICMEDLVHEISTLGPNFRAVANFFWPFKLSNAENPKLNVSKKTTGYCGDEINKMIETMN